MNELSVEQRNDLVERMKKSGHVNLQVVEDLWRRDRLTRLKAEYLENAPIGVAFDAWQSRQTSI